MGMVARMAADRSNVTMETRPMSARQPSHPAPPRRRARTLLAALLLGSTILSGSALVLDHPSHAAAPAAAALPGSFADLVERVSPAVVKIGRASCRERVCQYV